MKTVKVLVDCPKCCGKGNIPAFSGIAGGICFRCGGEGKVEYRKVRINKLSPINAMHCGTVVEAEAHRVREFLTRFPELREELASNPDALACLVAGGNVRFTLKRLGR